MRRALVLVALLLIAVSAFTFTIGPGVVERSQNGVITPAPYQAREAAARLHRHVLVADLHADPLLWGRDLLQRAAYGHVDVPRLIEGGVALQVFGVVTQVPGGQNYDSNALDTDLITALAVLERWPFATWQSPQARALYQADRLRAFAERSNGTLTLIENRTDLQNYLARRRGHREITAGLLAIEGLQAAEGHVANLDALYAAGFRMMGLAHFFDNEVAGSVHGVAKGGLTTLGRDAVRWMEAHHVIIDLAHASPQAIDDVLAVASRPVVVSHTGVKGTCDHIRNLSDEHVRRVAATGGVIGIGYWDAAVCDVTPAGIARAIQYAVGLVGPDHVGLGSDFDGATTTPFDTTGLVQLTDALLAAGVRDEDIGKIMGGNVIRILQETLPTER